jgi:polar amino acid transport system substrate-binding protein
MRSFLVSTRAVALSAALLTLPALAQVASVESARAALASTGPMRVVFLATNPMQGQVDPDTGEVTGIAADLAHEIGRRLDLRVEITPTPGVPAVMDAVASGAADIGFLAYAAPRAERVDFAQVYVLGHNSYIVRTDSPIRTLADADRGGVRVGSREGVSVDLYLSRTLDHATLIHLPRSTTEEEAAGLLLADEIDAYAANTERLAVVAASDPRLRVVDGSLMSAQQSIVVARGNSAGLAYLNAFLDEARESGLLQEIVDRYGLAGVEVAPR